MNGWAVVGFIVLGIVLGVIGMFLWIMWYFKDMFK